MGTTLSGKKIKDTYKSLVKLSDNGEAGSTGKQLSDGNGNDLGIYVDTDGVVGIGGAPAASLDASTKTDAIILPNGTDAQQPSGQAGMIRYNTDNTKFEVYDSAWHNIGIPDDDSVTHDKLSPRYTESGTLNDSATISVDASAKNIYTHTITQATTFNFTGAAIGQVLTLIITGDATNGITLGTINTNSATWNKISGDFDEANAVKNLIEIKFISTSEAWYQISQVAS